IRCPNHLLRELERCTFFHRPVKEACIHPKYQPKAPALTYKQKDSR
ncbi:jg179, partial [Pararge aegeria aegeria]